MGLCDVCDVLHHTATHCNIRRARGTVSCPASHCNTLQHTTTHCNTLQHQESTWNCVTSVTSCITLQHTATHYNSLQHTATSGEHVELCDVRDVLHHTVTHCNTLQHTATHCKIRRARGTVCHQKSSGSRLMRHEDAKSRFLNCVAARHGYR